MSMIVRESDGSDLCQPGNQCDPLHSALFPVAPIRPVYAVLTLDTNSVWVSDASLVTTLVSVSRLRFEQAVQGVDEGRILAVLLIAINRVRYNGERCHCGGVVLDMYNQTVSINGDGVEAFPDGLRSAFHEAGRHVYPSPEMVRRPVQ